MTANEIFSTLSKRLTEGKVFHERMADYYDFIGLMGYKRVHEYHAIKDVAEKRGIHRYFINHFNQLIPEPELDMTWWKIPVSWFNHERKDVSIETKKAAVKSAAEKWSEWEHETKRIFERAYVDLCDIDEVAAACKVKELISCVDMQSKCADRFLIELQSMDYDMSAICMIQDEILEKYDGKTKEIGVNIC